MKDVEFHIGLEGKSIGSDAIETNFTKACAKAVQLAVSHGSVNLDVVIWSVTGARNWGGDDGVQQYKEDPEASVFQRIVIKANDQGRVP